MNHNGKMISIAEVLWKVLRQPIALDLTIEQASEYALEILKLIGAPLSFLDKTIELKLCEYKAMLPDDLIQIKGVRLDNRAMRYATDIYHVSDDKGDSYHPEYTYIVQNCMLTASIKDGCIEMSYKAIALDENNYPLIPDNESYKMAIEYHILFRYLEALWTMGKITDKVFQYYSQKRDWYVGQASSTLTIANGDHLASILNGINRLIVNTTAYENFYKNYGTREHIKRYF